MVLIFGSFPGVFVAQQVAAATPDDAITLSAGNTTYTIGETPVVVDDALSLNTVTIDVYGNLNSVEITIVNYKSGDELGYTPADGIDENLNVNGELILEGAPTITVADYEKVLQSVTFSTTSTNYENRQIKFTLPNLPDDEGFQVSAVKTIEIVGGQAVIARPGGVGKEMLLWLRPDEGVTLSSEGNSISEWEDSSGHNHQFGQTDTDSQPILNKEAADKLINFNPAVSFDGENHFLLNQKGILGTETYANINMFFVAMTDSVLKPKRNQRFFTEEVESGNHIDRYFALSHPWNEHSIWTTIVGPENDITARDVAKKNEFDLWSFIFGVNSTDADMKDYSIWKNAVRESEDPEPSRQPVVGKGAPMYFGAELSVEKNEPIRHYSGQVGEFIIYSGDISKTEWNQINSYLAVKYGTSMNGSYLNSSAEEIWTKNDDYNHDIVGIARDDASGLHQKQSRSMNDKLKLTVGIGNSLAERNVDVDSELADLQSLLIGSNGKPIGNASTTDRKWKVQNTGSVQSVLIAIAADALPEGTELLVSSVEDFSTATIMTYALTKETLADEAYYVAHDVELNDGEYFSFVKSQVSPGGVTDIALWLDASDGIEINEDGKVSTWKDRTTGKEFNLDPTRNGVTLDDSIANFHPAVKFKDGLMFGKDNTNINVKELFVASKHNDENIGAIFATYPKGADRQGFFRNTGVQFANESGNVGTTYGNRTINAPDDRKADHLRLLGASAKRDFAWENGVAGVEGNETADTGAAHKLMLGSTNEYTSYGAGHLDGHFGELIVFDETKNAGDGLTEDELQRLNSYFAFKYGITLKDAAGKATNYTASDSTTNMWTAENNEGYGNRITGIGRDDHGGLNQKQSISSASDGYVTIALGDSIATTNTGNSKTIENDKSFFVFSDNGSLPTFATESENLQDALNPIRATTKTILKTEGTWKVDKTNWVDTDITLQLENDIDAKDYEYYLVIHNANDEFPADSELSIKQMEIDSDKGIATLNSSHFEDGSYFTFIRHVDKTALETRVSEIETENLQEEDYTSGWSAYTQALAAAKAVLADADKTISEVADALDALNAARDGLKGPSKLDYTEVVEVTDINPSSVTYDSDSGQFTVPSDVDTFTFKDGDKIVTLTKDSNGEWTRTEADTSIIVIITKPEANTVATAKPTFKGTATPGSTVKVKVSNTLTLEATADANGNWSVTPDEALPDGNYNIEITATIDGKTSEKDTKTMTIATADTAQLQARVDMSSDLEADDYTSDSWTTYNTALGAAKNILNKPDATQQEINDAYNALKNAQDALKLADEDAGIDKEKLNTKVAEADDLTAADYTPGSWTTYQEKLTAAQAVLDNDAATQAEVDQALEDLTNAENALEKKGGLGSLTPSPGSLSPPFSNDVYNYAMNVGNSTSELDFSYGLLDEDAKVTMTSNGVKVTGGKVPLKVGPNTIVIQVEDATGTKTYTMTVNRASPSTGGGIAPPTGPTTETIIVDVEVDGDQPVGKTPVEITRTTETDGTVSDRVELTLTQAQLAVDKALEIGNTIARIVLPDVKDEVDRATIEIPVQSVKLLKENGIDLEIYSNDALVTLPQTSMEGIEDDFYFRLVPVRKKSEQEEIEARAKLEQVVQQLMGSADIHIVARPMTIETNLSSRPVLVTLPLRDVKLPGNAAEREAFLQRLGVYIEHSDGEKEVVFAKVVDMTKGELGLQISVAKFSTFTILNFGEENGEHAPYIHGYEDGTFKPDKSITRTEVALMLARNLGYVDGETQVTVAPFKDVPLSSYGAGAIALLKELDIIDGYNGDFRGRDNMTRAEMAKVIARYMELDAKTVPVTFKDTEDLWSTYYIEAIRDAGIIEGYKDGSFRPQNNLSRAEAVRMLNRMFNRGPLNGTTVNPFPDVSSNHWAFGEILEAATTHTYKIDKDGQEWLVK